jgi:hypothetical protein
MSTGNASRLSLSFQLVAALTLMFEASSWRSMFLSLAGWAKRAPEPVGPSHGQGWNFRVGAPGGQLPALAVRWSGAGKRDSFVNTPQRCVATCCSNSTRAISHRSSVSIMTDRNVLYSPCDGGPSCWTNRATASEYSRAASANCSANLRRSLHDVMGEYQSL